jgi:hypothetical protein
MSITRNSQMAENPEDDVDYDDDTAQARGSMFMEAQDGHVGEFVRKDVEETRRISEEVSSYGPGMGFGTNTIEEARALIARRNAALGLDRNGATWSPDDVAAEIQLSFDFS